MQVEKFYDILNSDFFTGVPDSLLKPFCDYLMKKHGISKQHLIGANEGNCVGMAAGYYLSTGKVPVVYMQNSGIGNIANPVISLLNEKVYGIPCIFVVGWRGEPGVHDEPQHIFQGAITTKLLENMDIVTYVIDANTTETEMQIMRSRAQEFLDLKKSIAFVVKKGALQEGGKLSYKNPYQLNRESVIEQLVEIAKQDVVISTTGKISRELFEIREKIGQSHQYDFLTVGSMGHSSSIALRIAMEKKNAKIWCIDGDGAVLMHMGAMATIGAVKPSNMVHLVLNNEAHETVGGLPTVASKVNFSDIAKACGYQEVMTALTECELKKALHKAKISNQLTFIEVKVALGSRKDLGRPTTSAKENKEKFMDYLGEL